MKNTDEILRSASADFEEFQKSELDQSIIQRFQNRVLKYPLNRAVKTDGSDLTYHELNQKANLIAHELLNRCGDTSEPIALFLNQGVNLVAAIIAVLKSRKFYVPIDPVLSAEISKGSLATRVTLDSQVRLVVTDDRNRAAVASLVSEAAGSQVIEILNVDHELAASVENPELSISPDDRAYIFYTSGSTGRPKGVVDTHRNVLHNIMRYTNSLRIGPHDRLSLVQSPGFSGTVSSLFGALLNGAAIYPFEVRKEGTVRVADWLLREEITVFHSVPAIFRLLPVESMERSSLRVIRLEGDQASSRDVDIFKANYPNGCVLVNGLGATECGLVRQRFVDKGTLIPSGILPVGYAVEDMDVLILDDNGRELAVDCIGEIAVSSRYLSPGYWQRPERSSNSFIQDPQREGNRIYRTGDLGLVRSDGCLEFCGRKDSRRKIRGQWIDTAELETELLRITGIAEAVVDVRDDSLGNSTLVAYLVLNRTESLTAVDVRRQLTTHVTDWMIPSDFVMLARLPLTANGKVDRQSLPAPERTTSCPRGAEVDPPTELAGGIAAIWCELLERDNIGFDDNFFDLGGDSLRAMQLTNQLKERLSVDLPLATVFDYSTVRLLARFIEGRNIEGRNIEGKSNG